MGQIFASRLAQANLVTKADFDDKLTRLDKKMIQTKQKIDLMKMNLKTTKK